MHQIRLITKVIGQEFDVTELKNNHSLFAVACMHAHIISLQKSKGYYNPSWFASVALVLHAPGNMYVYVHACKLIWSYKGCNLNLDHLFQSY